VVQPDAVASTTLTAPSARSRKAQPVGRNLSVLDGLIGQLSTGPSHNEYRISGPVKSNSIRPSSAAHPGCQLTFTAATPGAFSHHCEAPSTALSVAYRSPASDAPRTAILLGSLRSDKVTVPTGSAASSA
jgi:hypothetical protein